MKNRVLWLVIFGMAVFAFGPAVFAQTTKIFNIQGDYIESGELSDSGDLLEVSDSGEPENDLGRGIYYSALNLLRGLELKGTLYIDQNGLRAIDTVEKPLTFGPTTTSAFQLLAVYLNPLEEDLIVKDWELDIFTQTVSLHGVIACGTTTASTTTGFFGDGIAGSAATSSSTIIQSWFLDKTFQSGDAAGGLIKPRNATNTGYIGTFFTTNSEVTLHAYASTTFEFMLKQNEAFTCTHTPDENASSTDYTSKGNFDGTGVLRMNIQHRNN